MPKCLFPTGVATETGAYLVIQVSDENGEIVEGNLYADYRFASNPDVFGTDWRAVGICYSEHQKSVFVAGPNGEVIRITDSGNSTEFIAPPSDGPDVQGPIREIRAIGSDLYAVGMGRQVYQRRAGEDRWERIDAGVLDTAGRATSGLTSITGDGQGRLVAVGYEGEIWEFHGAWTQVVSPTNILLTRVTLHQGKYYAAGLHGGVLCRDEAGWRVIDTLGFGSDIWDLETFRGKLYLGTTQGLFCLTSDEEVKLVDSETFTRQVNCASLSASRERLWCFGAEVVSTTEDGVVWREEPILEGT